MCLDNTRYLIAPGIFFPTLYIVIIFSVLINTLLTHKFYMTMKCFENICIKNPIKQRV